MRAATSAFFGILLIVGIFLPIALAKSEVAFGQAPEEMRESLVAIGDAIDGENVYGCIDEITKDFPRQYRVMGTPSQQLFLDMYGDVFSEMGLASAIVPFDEGGAIGVGEVAPGGQNVIGVYPGRDLTKWVVVGGHYDTRELTVGGAAHDNTSGICTVKEFARSIATLKPETEASIVFAWWDGEEWGLYGSVAFVNNHDAAKELLGLPADAEVEILAGVSIDMAGLVYPAGNPFGNGGDLQDQPDFQHFHLRAPPVTMENEWANFDYGTGSYEELKSREDFEAIREKFLGFREIVAEVAFKFQELPPEAIWCDPARCDGGLEEDNYGRSDHVPFTSSGIPGLRVQGAHDDEYPHYHNPTDTIEAMTHLAGSRELLVAGMDMETTSVAVVAGFVALKGGMGLTFDTVAIEATEAPAATPDVPGLEVPLIVAVLVAAAILRRR